MPNKPTITAAIIEANRAKNPIRHVIDYDHRAACMDVLIREARKREPMNDGIELEVIGNIHDNPELLEVEE